VVVIVWYLDLQLPVQPVYITTKDVSLNPVRGEVYSIQQYVINLSLTCDIIVESGAINNIIIKNLSMVLLSLIFGSADVNQSLIHQPIREISMSKSMLQSSFNLFLSVCIVYFV
jgi:hypothetical protein